VTRLGICTLLGLGLVLTAATTYADALAPPKDLPPNASAFYYNATTDAKKDVTFVKISKENLDRLVTTLKGKQANWAPPATRSIVAALAASIGLASVFLLRTNRATKVVMLFVVGLFALSPVAEAWNAAPMPPYNPQPAPAASFTHNGLLVFELKDQGPIEITFGTLPPPGRGPKFGPLGPNIR
jgi:hypothetical protein